MSFIDPTRIFNVTAQDVIGQWSPEYQNKLRAQREAFEDEATRRQREAAQYRIQQDYQNAMLQLMNPQYKDVPISQEAYMRQNALAPQAMQPAPQGMKPDAATAFQAEQRAMFQKQQEQENLAKYRQLQASGQLPTQREVIPFQPTTYGGALGAMQFEELQAKRAEAQDNAYRKQAQVLENEFKNIDAHIAKVTAERGDVSPLYEFKARRSAAAQAQFPNNPYLVGMPEGFQKLAESGLRVTPKMPSGASNLRVVNEAQRMVKDGEATDVDAAMPQAAENVKQADESVKDRRREEMFDQQWRRMASMQAAADRRFERRMDFQEFKSSVGPSDSAYKQASKFSTMAGQFEEKIKNNVDLLTEFMADYEKKHPIAKHRAGALFNDILEGKIQGSGKYANLQNVAGSIELELGKLESGSYGAAGATKHAVDAFSKLKMAKGLENIREQLGGIKRMAKSARQAQDTATETAEREVNSIRSQYGLPALMTAKKAEIAKPSKDKAKGDKKLTKRFYTGKGNKPSKVIAVDWTAGKVKLEDGTITDL